MRIDHRRPDIGMAEHFLDRAYVVIGLEQVGRERMSEGVRRDPLRQPRLPDRIVQWFLYVLVA